MQGQINPKIVGATIIGFALVGGAFTISSLKQPKTVYQPAAVSAAVPQRVAIAVTDNDGNGIEDWRDEFVTAQPVILNQNSSDYTAPETLTGQMSIGFMESVIRSKNYGPFGRSQEEVITDTVGTLIDETNIVIYDTPDIDIMRSWDDEDIVNYANTLAATFYRHNVVMEGEIRIVHDILVNKKRERITELETLASAYGNFRDDTLKIPVPAFLVKEHLDLINSFHALHTDIKAMTLVFEDPAVALLRLKRYEDDALGLNLALQNMYLALEPHADLITIDDPAALFVVFSPDFQN